MTESLSIGGHRIGNDSPCFIIAEAGTAHNGDLERAFRLIDAACRAGADCVKFQVVYADEIVHPRSGLIDLPGGKISLYERFKSLERDPEFFKKIKDHTEARGLEFLATPFGKKSALLLRELGVGSVKIASPELNHFPLLSLVGDFNVPVILSTGVSTLADIEAAVGILGEDVILLHCITSYPAPEDEYNLRLLPLLSRLFDRLTGVSDHSRDPVLVPLGGLLMGSCAVEKHLALSNEDGGLDDPFALTEKEFRLMVTSIRQAENQTREKNKRLLEKEFGKERTERMFGTGQKKMAPSEEDNYRTTRRSIMAVKDISPGESFTEENTALLRSEKNLLPGLDPRFFSLVLGKKAARSIPSGKGVEWEDL